MTDHTATGDWRDALAKFDEWLALPDAERDDWLGRLCAADATLHARLLSLIAADRDAEDGAFLDAGPAVVAAPAARLEGRRYGPWQIDRVIGTGGMGHVWLAHRTDGLYDGLAAIKLLRASLRDAAADARFAREGRLLGRLSHPNIARLLDAGVSAEGERYLVLEYVDGERIDRWSDERRLTLPQRIELFISVCRAVAHAHENLVVHRDLKPSNIVVDRAGQVKLLDFGVAKLLASDSAESSDLTREAGAAMTPQYAAPEQLTGGVITTATDVYGLGLVLYGLLNGSRPWDDGRTPAIPPVLTSEPRPLWMLAATGDDAQRIADRRGISVDGLRRALRGDLAAVVAKAIRTDAAERYRSVAELAADLQRVLADRPVIARPDSALYRVRKYARRHAVGLAATTLAVVAVAAGIAGTLIQQRQALREAERSVAIKRFLLDLFDAARTSVRGVGAAREATVDDVLSAGIERLGTAFTAQPDIRDEVFQILVELESDTGDQARTTQLARDRLAAARAAFGAEGRRSAPAEIMLAGVLMNFGELDEARPLLAHAAAVLDRAGDHTSLDRARLLRWQGIAVLLDGGHVPWAEHPLRRAAELLRERYRSDDELLATLATVPLAACRAGAPREAVEAARELLERTIARYGAGSLYALDATQSRGQILLRSGRPAEAVELLQATVAGYDRVLGEQHPNGVMSRLLLAKALYAAGRPIEGAKAVADARRLQARDHAADRRLTEAVTDVAGEIEAIQAGKPPTCGG